MPPARPSAGEVTHYERLSLEGEEGSATRWALLGATPEIRSLAARYRRELVCIDTNREVFEALRTLVTPCGLEQFVYSDWTFVSLSEPVDVAFGDGSINMLPPDKHVDFIESVHGMLKPRGRALLRVHVVEPPEFSTPKDIFAWYRTSENSEHVFTATRTHLDMLWVDKDSLKLDFAEYHERISRLYEQNVIRKEEYEGYARLLEYNKIELFYTTRVSFERQVSRYFHVESVMSSNDYTGSRYHPIYSLKKK